jgi:hypothetical protein
MIKTEIISDNILRITAPEKLKADDFRQIAPQVESMISRYGKIRLLIDASGFSGWEDNHAGFVKNHQQKVDRIAVTVAHNWQHWLIGAVSRLAGCHVPWEGIQFGSGALAPKVALVRTGYMT